MAKVKTKNNSGKKQSTKTLWEYQSEPGLWVPEDDEISASYKAVKATGKVRSCEETVVENRSTGERNVTRTNWVVRQQSFVK